MDALLVLSVVVVVVSTGSFVEVSAMVRTIVDDMALCVACTREGWASMSGRGKLKIGLHANALGISRVSCENGVAGWSAFRGAAEA